MTRPTRLTGSAAASFPNRSGSPVPPVTRPQIHHSVLLKQLNINFISGAVEFWMVIGQKVLISLL